MKYRSLYIISIMRLAFLVSLVFVVVSFKSTFVNTQHIAYTFDQRLAPTTIKQLKCAIHDLVHEQLVPEEISSKLITHYAAVQTVAIAQTLPKTMHVAVTGRTPWVRINDNKLLTKDGTLVDQQQYVPAAYELLPGVSISRTMAQERSVVPAVMEVVSKCYPLLSAYTLVFHNETNIVLHDKQEGRFAIVCSVNQLPDQMTIERCNRIRQDLLERGKFTNQLSRVWLVDTRFSNQIIVSADHGGEVYGANCV